MAALHGGRRDRLEIAPNLWAGVGLARGGAGTALVGAPEQIAARMREYAELGIDSFIFSGYPHLEEAYRFAELVFPPCCPNLCQPRAVRTHQPRRPIGRDGGQRQRAATTDGRFVSGVFERAAIVLRSRPARIRLNEIKWRYMHADGGYIVFNPPISPCAAVDYAAPVRQRLGDFRRKLGLRPVPSP